MADESCESCRYYTVVEGLGGLCTRFPPIPVYNPAASADDRYAVAKWSLVKPEWWCGEYKSKSAARRRR